MKRKMRVMTASLLITALCLLLLPEEMTAFADEGGNFDYVEIGAERSKEAKVSGMYQSSSGRTLANPRVIKDDSMEAGQKVTWDCVYFGNYPQSEVESSDPLYLTLQNAGGWDSKNEIIVNKERYRRIKSGDATYAVSGNSDYYEWSDSTTYHYFKYEPIKWRVLKVDGYGALFLSDLVLDDQRYNTVHEEVTWEKSTIRSWLNGYKGLSNQQGMDYSEKNFINSAFASSEQAAIQDTSVVNMDNINYSTEIRNNTADKVFLLSGAEVYSDSVASYGFVSDGGTNDEARRCRSSIYAKAMGVYSNASDTYKDNCYWWLRTPGSYSDSAAWVYDSGQVDSNGKYVSRMVNGVRVALNLDLSSNLWTDAGVVSSKEGDLSFRVEYDANGGDGAPDSQIKQSGTSLTLSNKEPDRSGYVFLGWSSDRNAQNVSYHAGEKYAEDDNVMLYAVWKKEAVTKKLANPRIEKNDSMSAGQKVTWDCVWFGNYPQSEVETSDPIYRVLQDADEWDDNNDITIEGNRYRRMKRGDATYSVSEDNSYYVWSVSDTYHFFKYEPIKWRVLKVEGNQVLLLSDITLDNQKYNVESENVTWETSTIRSWLNGYGKSYNQQKIDYTRKNYINTAFTSREQSVIVDAVVINKGNTNYGTAGGNNTTDKLFFLSEEEVCGDDAVSQGFVLGMDKYDEARRCKGSTYARAMGIFSWIGDDYKDDCRWWLRSPGCDLSQAADVSVGGIVDNYGWSVDTSIHGVRPAMILDLSSNLWVYAGETDSSEGNIYYEVKYHANGGSRAPDTQIKRPGEVLTLSKNKPVRSGYTFLGWSLNKNAAVAVYRAGGKFIDDRKVILYAVWKKNSSDIEENVRKKQKITTSALSYTKACGSKTFSLKAKANTGGRLTYSSSNKKVASVSKTGKVTVKSYGTTKITIKAAATQKYLSAVKKITVKVVPKRVMLKSVKSPEKKKLTFTWKKDKDVTGYEIYVSPRKDFKRETIKRNYKKSVSSKTISGWRSKRTYYVKIRAYKKVGKKTYYSAWSKAKKVKVK